MVEYEISIEMIIISHVNRALECSIAAYQKLGNCLKNRRLDSKVCCEQKCSRMKNYS